MTQAINFAGEYRSPPLQSLIPGKWYIGFTCKACGLNFAIMNEPTDTGGLELSGDAHFAATCPNCYAKGDYAAADLVQFAAAQGGPSSTA